MINFKFTKFAIIFLITASSNAFSQSMNSFSATCNSAGYGTVKIAYIKEANQVKTITNRGQLPTQISTIKNPKNNSDALFFSDFVNNRSHLYVLNRKSGILEIEILNGLGSDLLKYQCEKSDDDSSVLKEIYELQNQPNKF